MRQDSVLARHECSRLCQVEWVIRPMRRCWAALFGNDWDRPLKPQQGSERAPVRTEGKPLLSSTREDSIWLRPLRAAVDVACSFGAVSGDRQVPL